MEYLRQVSYTTSGPWGKNTCAPDPTSGVGLSSTEAHPPTTQTYGKSVSNLIWLPKALKSTTIFEKWKTFYTHLTDIISRTTLEFCSRGLPTFQHIQIGEIISKYASQSYWQGYWQSEVKGYEASEVFNKFQKIQPKILSASATRKEMGSRAWTQSEYRGMKRISCLRS